MPVAQFLERLQRLNPDYKKGQGSDALRLGRGVRGSATPPVDGGAPQDTTAPEEFDPNQVANILNSPLYTQNLQDYYLSTYAPGLTQATYNINQAQTEFGTNEADRARQRGEAIRRVAGGYAARGMRSPGAINKDRSEIQSEFGKMTREEQNRIQSLLNERDVMFGAGAKDGETFLSDPTLFGSIGAGARRDALSGLQQLPERYGLLGLGASTAPLMEMEQESAAASATQRSAPKPNKPKVTKPKSTGPTAAERRAAEAAAQRKKQQETAARNTARNAAFKAPKLATRTPGRTAR
jgi:hypothetical protein